MKYGINSVERSHEPLYGSRALLFSATMVYFAINLGPIVYINYSDGFRTKLDNETTLIFTLDVLFTFAAISLFYFAYGKRVSQKILRKSFVLCHSFMLIGVISLLIIANLEVIGLDFTAITREQLVFENESSRVYQLVHVPAILMASILVSIRPNLLSLLLSLTIISLAVVHTLSRTPIIYFVFMLLFYNVFILKRKPNRLSILAIIVLPAAGGLVTVLQGRSELLANALSDVAYIFFRYRAFSLFLYERIQISWSVTTESLGYPFFGFFYEKALEVVFGVDRPFSTGSSTVLTDKVSLGYDSRFNANVLYPWISFFVATFGPLGLLVKAFYQFFLLVCLYRFRLYFSTLYFVWYLYFFQSTRHVFLNIDSAYTFMAIVLIDATLLIAASYYSRR